MTEDQIREINTSELAAETMKLKNEGYRLIQMGVTGKSDGRWELTYSFGKDYENNKYSHICKHLSIVK